LDVRISVNEHGLAILEATTSSSKKTNASEKGSTNSKNQLLSFDPLGAITFHRYRRALGAFYVVSGPGAEPAKQTLHVFACTGDQGFRVSELIELYKHGPLFRPLYPDAAPVKQGEETWL
jgi:hypothetical protein